MWAAMASRRVRSLLLLWGTALVLSMGAAAALSMRSAARESDASTLPPPKDPKATPAPFTLADKEKLCAHDYSNFNRVLKLMTVDPKHVGITNASEPPTTTPVPATTTTATHNDKYPRIFCYVNTISPYHKTHAQLVADTWGQRCDKLVFFSNDTGTMTVNEGTPYEVRFPIVKMSAPADYWHLWMKHKEVLKYVYDHYRHDFDWFYKADDDAYVIMDNLRAYLKRPEMVMNYKRQPIHLGKRFNLTADRIHGYIDGGDRIMGQRWWEKWDRWVFNAGGPGYAMNRLYLDKFVGSMADRTCLSGKWAQTQPEDTGTAYCMMWHDVVPWDTRDLHGRPRWHADDPNGAYSITPEIGAGWWFDYHQGVGGMKWGQDCCAPDSVGFHYIKGKAMHHMERQLYFCREGDDVPDIETFNRKYGLAISPGVLKPPK